MKNAMASLKKQLVLFILLSLSLAAGAQSERLEKIGWRKIQFLSCIKDVGGDDDRWIYMWTNAKPNPNHVALGYSQGFIECRDPIGGADYLIREFLPNLSKAATLNPGARRYMETADGQVQAIPYECRGWGSKCGDFVRNALMEERENLVREFADAVDRLKKKNEVQAVQRNEVEKTIAETGIDTVAKVLNYTSGCDDEGCPDATWIAQDAKTCLYKKIDRETGQSLMTIKLSDLDPQSVRIVTRTHTEADTGTTYNYTLKRNIPTSVQKTWESQDIDYMGRTMFSGINLDVARLKRGWTLIYSKYCRGTQKEF